MFKYVLLCLTLAVSYANGALIASAQAICDGFSSDFGTTSASCVFSMVNVGFLQASASGNIIDHGNIGGSASASYQDSSRFNVSAGIGLSEDFVFTVTGGTGDGFFVGCFSGSVQSNTFGASAGGSFGGSGVSINNGQTVDTCGSQSNFLLERQPFTFGLPQDLTVAISASAGTSFVPFAANAQAHITWGSPEGLLLLFDSDGNPISANYTLVPAPVPEPSARSLLTVALMFFIAVPIIFRGRSSQWRDGQ